MQNQYYWALTDDVIAHHGILGQKWGVRRFQDYNGKRIGSREPTSPQGLSNFMKKNISYDSSTHPLKTTLFWRLQRATRRFITRNSRQEFKLGKESCDGRENFTVHKRIFTDCIGLYSIR